MSFVRVVRDHQVAVMLLWAVATLAACGLAFYVGMTTGRDMLRSAKPAPSASTSAAEATKISPVPGSSVDGVLLAPPLPTSAIILPKSPDDVPAWDPPGVKRDPDMEVCRSINTSCSGTYNQDLCKGSRGWSTILTPGQVNCVVAAQGLAYSRDRVRWIQNCAPVIHCRMPL